MKKNIIIVLSSLLLFSSSFIYQDDWFQFESSSFSIQFPRKPETQIQNINSAVGELKMEITMYDGSKDNDENYLYGIITSDYPDSIINSDMVDKLSSFFRNSIDGAVSNVQGKLLSEKNIEINKFPGREVRVDYKDGLAIILMRCYLVHNKMVFTQTITDPTKEFNPAVLRFHDSFKLK